MEMHIEEKLTTSEINGIQLTRCATMCLMKMKLQPNCY